MTTTKSRSLGKQRLDGWRLLLALASGILAASSPSHAENGPYASLVDVGEGVQIDVDVRWPDTGTAPEDGYPVIFWTHGCNGTKASPTVAGYAQDYANDGYVTLAYTNRDQAAGTDLPEFFANDIEALKEWLINDFATEASAAYGTTVDVTVDPERFGQSGNSRGGYTTWSGVLLTDALATAVPRNWTMNAFSSHFVRGGSIERQTGAVNGASTVPTLEYPATELAAGFDSIFGPTLAEFPNVTIPVLSQIAFLDSRVSGTASLEDHLALTGSVRPMAYIGTGGHGTPDTDAAFRADLMARWFAFHLKDEANGIDAENPILLSLLVSDEKISLPSWPPPDQEIATLYLRENETLGAAAPAGTQAGDLFVNDPGSFTWFDALPNFSTNGIRAALPRQTVAYQTPPLTESVLLVGQPEVSLHVSGTGSRYQVNVHLYDIGPAGEKVLLAYGTSMLDTSPAVAEISLSLTGRRVPAGHSLRLEATNRDDQDLNHSNGFQANGDQLRYTPFFEYSDTRVYHDASRPSSLRIPLIGRNNLPLGDGCDVAGSENCTLIRASRIKILDDDVEPIITRKRKLSFRSSAYRGEPSGIVEPAFGSAGDPTVAGSGGGGAVLTLYRVDGEESDVATYTLPASLWTQTGNESKPGYRYRDSAGSAGPITKIVLGRGRLVIAGKGEGVYALAAAPQEEMALRLQLGAETSFCTAAPARSPAIKFDSTRKFDAEKNLPPPTICPPMPGSSPYGSASVAFIEAPATLLH